MVVSIDVVEDEPVDLDDWALLQVDLTSWTCKILDVASAVVTGSILDRITVGY
jgi:hypothetical protein